MGPFEFLALLGGLSLFLFGMSIMGQSLERRAGAGLRGLLGKLTTNRLAGLLTGIGVTAVIQSSSAATVMVVGFVNSGIMSLTQAINVIMGANVGTTVTAWILSLGDVDSNNLFIQLLKPASFTPILAFIGIISYMFGKGSKKKDAGMIFLGFATLMFGMDAMSDAVSGLGEVSAFRQLFLAFENPLLGVLAGTLLTAVLQSSSASVGILQALATTGQVTYGAAVPIIMGQNIGTCVTALLSSVGANKNAKRAAFVHLSFNVIGTAVWLFLFVLSARLFQPAFLSGVATKTGIAVSHTVFNVLCTLLLLPMAKWLEGLVRRIVPDDDIPETAAELDERLLATPPIALERCRHVTEEMAGIAARSLDESMTALTAYTPRLGDSIRSLEEKTDHYEDVLSTYLLKLSACRISESDNAELIRLHKIVGDLERISDHAVNLLESAEGMHAEKNKLTADSAQELNVLSAAVREILTLTVNAFARRDTEAPERIEPLEEVIDGLKEQMRANAIRRLQRGECPAEECVVLSDVLTDLERAADHCSNIAGCVRDADGYTMNLHQVLRGIRNGNAAFAAYYAGYAERFSIDKPKEQKSDA